MWGLNREGRHLLLYAQATVTVIIIIIIKRISRAPIYHTKWQHRALYNNTNHTHAHTHTHTHTHTHILIVLIICLFL